MTRSVISKRKISVQTQTAFINDYGVYYGNAQRSVYGTIVHRM